jgi:hypothetical protein
MAGLDGKALGAMSALLGVAFAGAAACSGSPANATGGTAGNGGAKNQGGSTSVGTTASVTSTAVATGTVGAGGSGGGAGGSGGAGGMDACNPAAAAGSFWAQTAQAYGDISPVSMCQYRGDVLLVVNTAAV